MILMMIRNMQIQWTLVLCIFLLLFFMLYAYRVREKEIYVETVKPLTDENKYGRKTVIDKDNFTYNTTNSIFHCHFRFEEIHSQLSEKKMYIIKCYGYRIPFLEWYPNILEVRDR